MNLIVLEAPPVAPVSLSDVYDHLRLTTEGSPPSHPQDAMLTRLIEASTADAESYTHRSFVERTLRLVGPAFPGYGMNWVWPALRSIGRVELLKPPIIAIDAVTYYDSANVLRTVSSSDYYLTESLVQELTFGTGYSYPVTYYRTDAFRIDYRAGYAAAGSPPDYVANIPAPIKQAILLGVELQYSPLTPAERESMEKARDCLLTPYVVHTVA